MGSLPNLNEIGKEEENFQSKTGQDHLIRGHPQSFRNERCKIRYRQSERGDLPRPRRKLPVPSKWVPFDDVTVQQTITSSPASPRNANITHVTRRKDSLSSSIGGTSVRRLISVVRNSHNRPGPHYNRRVLIRYLIIFCISHLFFNTTFLPFIVLQGSVSVWTLPFQTTLPVTVNIGSSLLALMYILAATSTLFGPYIVNKLGASMVLIVSYGVFSLFYVIHLYPAIYLLIPAYSLLGLALGQVSLCYTTLLMGLSSKMSYAISDYDDELRQARRTVIIRRFARAIQATQDLGLIFGSLMVAILIAYWREPVINPFKTCEENLNLVNCSNCAQNGLCTACPYGNISHSAFTKNCSTVSALPNQNTFLDNIFNVDEHGHRICGASACASNYLINFNSSHLVNIPILHPTASMFLSIIFAGFCALALITFAFGLGKLTTYVNQDALDSLEFAISFRAIKESFKDVKLQLAAPLAVFIGMEQAFIYSDFSKSYVICTLGIQHLHLVFLSMGVLQSIAACTLSMLLKSIEAYYIVAVGFIFQCCVLMVKILWKPMSDDPALFYVIPAVWGVCNAIWEILTFSFLTSLYMDNWSAPFCNFTFFKFVGLALSFTFHGLFCNWIKLYVLAISMVIAVIPFFCLEISLARSQRNLDSNRL